MSTFLTADWRKLIMAQYEVPPEMLAPWLPAGVALDLWQGRCYVSLVGFLFEKVRLKGLPIPFHTNFEEINLRFYVVRTEPDGARKRGVVFISEFVPRFAITWIARSLYEENYATMPTQHAIRTAGDTLFVEYGWKHRDRWQLLGVEAETTPVAMPEGSEEEFVFEHYWGYTRRRGGATSAYEVKHPRWNVYPIKRFDIDADFGALYGTGLAGLTDQEPASVFLAEGGPVSVQSGAGGRLATPE